MITISEILTALFPSMSSVAKVVLLWALSSLVEYWLGRTDKVKAGSILEFVLLSAKAILKKKEIPNEQPPKSDRPSNPIV